MKTKLTIGIGMMAAALFLLVPSAAPKGKPAGTPMSASCAGPDLGDTTVCTVRGGGIVANESYHIIGTDSCGQVFDSDRQADASGVLTLIVFDPDTGGVECGDFTFSVYSEGRRGSTLVGTATAADTI